MEALLGLGLLVEVLAVCSSVLWVFTLRTCSLKLLGGCLPIPTIGLMVGWSWIKFQVIQKLGPVCMLMCLALLGGIVNGAS